MAFPDVNLTAYCGCSLCRMVGRNLEWADIAAKFGHTDRECVEEWKRHLSIAASAAKMPQGDPA